MGDDNLKIELVNKDDVINALIPILCEFSVEPYTQGRIIGSILNCPVSYDVEKVVEQLEKLEDTDTREVYFTHHIELDEAIEIVKNGGV